MGVRIRDVYLSPSFCLLPSVASHVFGVSYAPLELCMES